MIEEAVIGEIRAQWIDMAARVPFTHSEDRVYDSRELVESQVYREVREQAKVAEKISVSARALQASADTFDVG